MNENPYTEVSGRLPKFFEKIQTTGIPNVVDSKWLASIGYKSKADVTILRVLRSMDFIDKDGKPTERWKNYRDRKSAPKIIAQAVKDNYSELFSTYPDANKRSPSELKSFFAPQMNVSDATLNKVVATFNALVSISDFGASNDLESEKIPILSDNSNFPNEQNGKTQNDYDQKPEGLYTLNINIQLTLPITTDEKVYDELFKSLKKNLFP